MRSVYSSYVVQFASVPCASGSVAGSVHAGKAVVVADASGAASALALPAPCVMLGHDVRCTVGYVVKQVLGAPGFMQGSGENDGEN